MDQLPLWTPPVEGMTWRCHHRIGSGWELVVVVRRAGQSWDQALSTLFEQLTTEELLDVVSSVLASDLGL